MQVDLAPTIAPAAEHRFTFRAGAIAALLVSAGYLVIIPLYFRAGAPPHDASSWFAYLPGKADIWWAIVWLSVFTDVLFLPIAVVLYQALQHLGAAVMRVAASLFALFVAVDLSVTWTHYASILTLFDRFSATADPARRQSALAAAEYASAILSSLVEVFYSIVILSAGILLVGIVMLRSRFSRFTAWLGILTGILGILSLTGWPVAIIGNALCATAWLILVAVGLLRLARS